MAESPQIRQLHQEITDLLANDHQIKLAILFGSAGRDALRPDSDLDVAVAGETPLSAEEKKELIEALAVIAGRPIDLIDLQAAGEPILSVALTTGQLIYCSDRRLYAELIKRMVFNNADCVPYRNRLLATRRRAWTRA